MAYGKKSLMKQLGKIEKMANESLQNEVAEIVKQEMIEAINKSVYDAYIPSQYTRRGTKGGFKDIRNLRSSVEDGELKVWNITRAVGDDKGQYLDKILVDGDKYTWGYSRIYQSQPLPRDFIQATYNRLIQSKAHKEALKTALQKRGLTVV